MSKTREQRLTIEQVKSAIWNAAHSEFDLAHSGLNVYLLTEELNKRLAAPADAQCKRHKEINCPLCPPSVAGSVEAPTPSEPPEQTAIKIGKHAAAKMHLSATVYCSVCKMYVEVGTDDCSHAIELRHTPQPEKS